MLYRYVDNIFSPVHQPTVGVDFFLKEIAVDASRGATVHTVHVQLWDMAGQDRSKKINRVSTYRMRSPVGTASVYSSTIYPTE